MPKIPKFRLPRKYFTDVIVTEPTTITWPDGKQNQCTSTRSEDHPKFTELREKLSDHGYIYLERRWWNGDIVLKQFYLNGKKFSVGDKFLCACALDIQLQSKSFYDNSSTK